MTIYLGPAGNLQALPYAGRGISASLDLGASTQRALGGARTVDYVGTPRRTYGLERKYLTDDEVGVVEGLFLGAYGPGPFVLLDPWRRNMLSANQSTTGDTLGDTTGFYVVGTGSVATSTASPSRGLTAIRHVSAATGVAGTSGVRLADTTSAATVIATGTPCLPSTPYAASALIRSAAGTPAPWVFGFSWYTAAGAVISGSSGGSVTPTGAYAAITALFTSPSTAAFMAPRVLNSSTLAASNTIDLDDLMVSQASVVESWVPGTGVPRVAFTELTNAYPFAEYHDASFTLQEVG